MEDYQQRVVDEKATLVEKIDKLDVFLNSTAGLDPEERQRMTRQHDIMCDYAEVLGQRIAAFSES